MTAAGTTQDRSDFVSVAEAARIFGTSPATVKRRIKAGTLEAEQLQRPQGFEYRVRAQRDESAPAGDDAGPSIERSDSKQPAPSTGTMQDVSAAIGAATTPLLGRLAVADVTIAEQAAAIRELEREVGRLTAQVERLSTVHQDGRHGPGASNLTAEAQDLTTEPQPPPDPFSAPLPPLPNWRDRAWLRRLVAILGLGAMIALTWPR